MKRQGISLLELLLVVAVITVLLGLILPATQKVRAASLLVRSKNNLKQNILALHQVSDSLGGFMGGFTKADPQSQKEWTEQGLHPISGANNWISNPHYFIMQHNQGLPYWRGAVSGRFPYFNSPGDPSDSGRCDRATGLSAGGPTSYSFNMCAFVGPLRFPQSLGDGAASTIALSENYCERFFTPVPIGALGTALDVSYLAFLKIDPALPSPIDPSIMQNRDHRRPSFADAGWQDVVPITDHATHTTRASVPEMTFLVRPLPMHANPTIPNTPFAAGLPVAMFDGSVRVIRGGISEGAFWSAVTPKSSDMASFE